MKSKNILADKIFNANFPFLCVFALLIVFHKPLSDSANYFGQINW